MHDETLPYPDFYYLDEAEGWYELGSYNDALSVLISLKKRYPFHLSLLQLEFEIYWTQNGWGDANYIAELLRIYIRNSCKYLAICIQSWTNCIESIKSAEDLHSDQKLGSAILILKIILEEENDLSKVGFLCYYIACFNYKLKNYQEAREWFGCAFKSDPQLAKAIKADPDFRSMFEKIEMEKLS